MISLPPSPPSLPPSPPPSQSVWVKKGTMQWWRDWKPHKWVDVRFALEQFSGPEGNQDGILFLYYNFNEEKKVRGRPQCLCMCACVWVFSVMSYLVLVFSSLSSSPSFQYLHAFINEVTILVPVLNDSKHTFAIYTAERTKQRWPIRLAAATELEMHDWVGYMITVLHLNQTHSTSSQFSLNIICLFIRKCHAK